MSYKDGSREICCEVVLVFRWEVVVFYIRMVVVEELWVGWFLDVLGVFDKLDGGCERKIGVKLILRFLDWVIERMDLYLVEMGRLWVR